jgi:hypothetical protein
MINDNFKNRVVLVPKQKKGNIKKEFLTFLAATLLILKFGKWQTPFLMFG